MGIPDDSKTYSERNNPTDNWLTPNVENDVKAGSKFKYAMATEDGNNFF
ncbi:hypothetical protein [Flavobacterium fluviatile]|nr:hypothetical protein [Flavobacterium fluviatile]